MFWDKRTLARGKIAGSRTDLAVLRVKMCYCPCPLPRRLSLATIC